MELVINALQYKARSSGIGVLLRELYGRVAEAAGSGCRVVLPKGGPAFPCGEGPAIVRAPYRYEQSYGRMLYQSFGLGKECRDSVLLTTDCTVPLALPKSARLATLVTDMGIYRHPESYLRTRERWWRFQYEIVRRRCDAFFAISEFTKREMAEVLGIAEERIQVIPCAGREGMRREEDRGVLEALRRKYGLPERFVLFVGNWNPRKNLERQIRAFDRMKEESGLPHELVIAGERGWKFDREQALTGLRHRESVHFIGYVPDEEMAALYTAAELFCFVTQYEGFGIPVVEAQSCGTPVLTGRGSALPETAGDGALFAEEESEESISRGLRRILEDRALAAELVEKGYANAKRYSWERSAQALTAALKERYGI